MSTANPHALLAASEDQTYNKEVTNQEPSFIKGDKDHEGGYFDDVLDALETKHGGGSAQYKAYNEWKEARENFAVEVQANQKQLKKDAKAVGQGQGGTALSMEPDLRYRLEATSQSHRMGDYLKGAYDEFLEKPSSRDKILERPDFFRWVEEQVAKDPGAAERWNPTVFAGADPVKKQKLVNWFQKGVKYIKDDLERTRYAVKLEGDGTIQRREPKKNGQIADFDSKELIDHFKTKPDPNPVGACIWVMSPNGNFYTHVGKLGRFHHSSFQGGDNVEAAGEWKVSGGKLKELDGTTGHYKVGSDGFVKAVQALAGKNALQADTVVNLYAKNGDKVPVNAIEFAKKPADFLKDKTTFNPGRHGQTV